MISEQDKQAILNGAYGISRKGYKCKFVGLIHGTHSYTHMFVYFNNANRIINTENLNSEFHLKNLFESLEDVIGLWEDKPEPFNLDKALKGEPVMTRVGEKAFIKYQLPEECTNSFSLGGYIIKSETNINHYSWSLTGKAVEIKCNHPQDIIGMWKDEPVSNTVTLPLPCPLKEPQDKMWIVTYGGAELSLLDKTISAELFDKRIFFGSKEDAQAWFDAMRDNRR